METASCKPSVTTTSPDSPYKAMFGYHIMGTVAPGGDSFSGSKTLPGDNAESSCTWTWSFARKK